MFKVGEKYDYEMLDAQDDKGHPDVNTVHQREVLAVDGPLVQFQDCDGATVIINTHSSIFIRAKVSRVLGTPKFPTPKPPKGA